MKNKSTVPSIKDCTPTNIRDLGNEYHNAFVTFIDILGFKNIVENEEAESINSRLDAMLLFNKLPQKRRDLYSKENYLPMTVQISDSIIRIQPVPLVNSDDFNILDFFIGELESLIISQGNLACNGIFIRGGITFGKICVHKSRIFGPAFNRAYQLESNLARYPRIILDDNIIADRNNPLLDYIKKYDWNNLKDCIFELLHRDFDGLYFTQYLTHILSSKKSKILKYYLHTKIKLMKI